jgi:probable HAF family extracellular repeat protein
MIDLGGGYQASASAINDAGHIVGNGTDLGAFLYFNGKMIPLGIPSGAASSVANAINSTVSMIAGVLYFSSGASPRVSSATVSGPTWERFRELWELRRPGSTVRDKSSVPPSFLLRAIILLGPVSALASSTLTASG